MQKLGLEKRYATGVIVVVFAAAVLGWTMCKSDNLSATQLTETYMSEVLALPDASTGQGDENPLWLTAKQAYKKGDFAAAAKNIAAIEAPNEAQILYQSLALMYQKPPDLDNAAAGFVLLMRRNINFKDEARWFYTLIALKKGEKEAAVSMLENVIGQRNNYSEKAAILLKKLK